MAVMFHRTNHGRHDGPQLLAADAIARLPQYGQRLPYRLIVNPFT